MPAFIRALFKQRRMERQNISLLCHSLQRQEIPLVTAIGARRIAQQGFDAPGLKTLLQSPRARIKAGIWRMRRC